MPVFLILAVAAVSVGVWLWQKKMAEERRRALAAWALSRGFRFSGGEDGGMEGRFPQFSCLRQGDNRYAYNVIRGEASGRRVTAFDYHYQTYTTDAKGRRQTHHHHFSAVVVEPGFPLKPLFLRPEGFLDRVGEFFGYDDIDFESAEFSRRFYVKAPDRRWAFDVFHQATMELMLGSPSFTVEFDGVAMARRDSTFEPAAFAAALGLLEGVLGRIPKDLVRPLGGNG